MSSKTNDTTKQTIAEKLAWRMTRRQSRARKRMAKKLTDPQAKRLLAAARASFAAGCNFSEALTKLHQVTIKTKRGKRKV